MIPIGYTFPSLLTIYRGWGIMWNGSSSIIACLRGGVHMGAGKGSSALSPPMQCGTTNNIGWVGESCDGLLSSTVWRELVVCASEWKPPTLPTESPSTLFIIMENWCIKMSISEIILVRYVHLREKPLASVSLRVLFIILLKGHSFIYLFPVDHDD